MKSPKEVLKQILEYDGPVFGASAIECGHYENLSLDEAKEGVPCIS